MPGELRPLAEVMVAFRDGHALYSDGGFEVFAVTSELAQGYFASPACGFIGSIFFRNSTGKETLSCLLVFGNYRGMDWAESRDAFDLFARLAKRAGAQLPLDAQKQLSAKQNDAAGTWLAFMTLYSPPVDDQHNCRRSWGEPFLSAANAIERYLLDTLQATPTGVTPAANQPGQPSRRDPEILQLLHKILRQQSGALDADERRAESWLKDKDNPVELAMLRALYQPGEWQTAGRSAGQFRNIREALRKGVGEVADRFTSTKAGDGCRIVYNRLIIRQPE